MDSITVETLSAEWIQLIPLSGFSEHWAVLNGFSLSGFNKLGGAERIQLIPLSGFSQNWAVLSGFSLSGFNKLGGAERIQSERIQ